MLGDAGDGWRKEGGDFRAQEAASFPYPLLLCPEPSSCSLIKLDICEGSAYPQNPDVPTVDVQAFVGSQKNLFINIVKEIKLVVNFTINCNDSDFPVFRVFPTVADVSFHNNPHHTG